MNEDKYILSVPLAKGLPRNSAFRLALAFIWECEAIVRALNGSDAELLLDNNFEWHLRVRVSTEDAKLGLPSLLKRVQDSGLPIDYVMVTA